MIKTIIDTDRWFVAVGASIKSFLVGFSWFDISNKDDNVIAVQVNFYLGPVYISMVYEYD